MPRERVSTTRRIVLLAAGLAAVRLLLHLALRAAHGGFTFLLSPTEIERTRLALEFAARPSFAPLGVVYWLPLQFWLEGGLLRLWPDALAVPFAVNTAASLLTVAGVVLWTAELAGEGAALAAGLGVLFSGMGLVLGIGGTADPLAHAALVWALFFWARFERTERPAAAWASAACLALGCAARYEAWLVAAALTAAAALDRRRAARTPLAAAWLFPAAWAAYNAATAGAPWAFATQTLGAEIRDLSLPRWELSLSFLSDFLYEVPPWLIGLTLAGAVAQRRPPRSYWLVLGAVAAFFVGLHPLGMFQVDEHHWLLYLLALPAAGAALAGWLSGLPAARRRAAAAGAAAVFAAAQAVLLFVAERYYESRIAPLSSVYARWRSLRREGAVAAADAVLVELPEGPRRGVQEYRLWQLEPGLRGIFDREFRLSPDGFRLDPAGNPSALDRPRAELGAWLKEKRVRAVVASRHGAALAALGWTRVGGTPPAGVWCAAGDGLARRWTP